MADEYTFTGKTGKVEGKPDDVDLDHDSPHHTLGKGPLQAASGVHKHTVSEITDMPSSGLPHDHSGVYSLVSHTHPAVTNADTVDNMHFNWDDRGVMSTYLWGVNNYGDSYLVYIGRFDARFAAASHAHSYAAVNHGAHPVLNMGTSVVTTDGAGQVWLTHSSGGSGLPLVSNGDWPAHNRAPHIGAWNGASFRIDNLNTFQLFRANWIVN